jgi:hypothetical protein
MPFLTTVGIIFLALSPKSFFVAEDNKSYKNILKEFDYCHGRPWAKTLLM